MSGEITVASYNVHKAVGSDFRRDSGRILSVLEELDADLVALQEVDRRFGARNGVLDLAQIERRTGLRPIVTDQRLGMMADGWHGNLILTRTLHVDTVRGLHLPGLEPRGAVVADLRHGHRRLRVLAAHLGLLHVSRQRQARLLAAMCEDLPVLFLGDTNEWRRGHAASLQPLTQAMGAGDHIPHAPSFPARAPVLPLDRIIAGRGLSLGPVDSHDSATARRASDHLPLRARLRWT